MTFDIQKGARILFYHTYGTVTKQREDHGGLSQYRRILRWDLWNRPGCTLLFRHLSG